MLMLFPASSLLDYGPSVSQLADVVPTSSDAAFIPILEFSSTLSNSAAGSSSDHLLDNTATLSVSASNVATSISASLTVGTSSGVPARESSSAYVTETSFTSSAHSIPNESSVISASTTVGQPSAFSTTTSYEPEIPLSGIQSNAQSSTQSLFETAESSSNSNYTFASQTDVATSTTSQASSTDAAHASNEPRVLRTTGITLGAVGGVAFLAVTLAWLLRVRRKRNERRNGLVDLDAQIPWSKHESDSMSQDQLAENGQLPETVAHRPTISYNPYLSANQPVPTAGLSNSSYHRYLSTSALMDGTNQVTTPGSAMGTLPNNIVSNANSFGPLTVTNYGPADRSRVSSTAGLQAMFDSEYGTPRAGMTEARFLTVAGSGLEVPWAATAQHSNASVMAQTAETGYWSGDRKGDGFEMSDQFPEPWEDKFTRIPQRRNGQ